MAGVVPRYEEGAQGALYMRREGRMGDRVVEEGGDACGALACGAAGVVAFFVSPPLSLPFFWAATAIRNQRLGHPHSD